MAGNIESHSTLNPGQSPLNITAVLDFQHYGFSKLKVINSTALSMSFILGQDGSVGDELTLVKKTSGSATSSSSPSSSSSAPTYSATPVVSTTTEVVTAYTTYCPASTVIAQGSSTYTVTEVRSTCRRNPEVMAN
jgi:acid phosphatase